MIDIIIIAITIFGVVSSFKKDQNKKKSERAQKRESERRIQSRTYQEPRNIAKDSTKKNENKKYGLGNILNEVQKTLEDMESSLDNSNKDVKEILTRKTQSPFKKQSNLEPQVLEVKDKREEAKLTPKRLKADRMKEYETSLYGEDDENAMFDYNYHELNSQEDLEELEDLLEDLISEDGKRFNLKEGIIFKEILDKPLSTRNRGSY